MLFMEWSAKIADHIKITFLALSSKLMAKKDDFSPQKTNNMT